MNIADLFATFRIKGDPKGLSTATKQIDKFAGHARTQIAAVAGAAAIMFGVKDALEFDTSVVRLERAGNGKLGTLDEIRDKVLDVSDATSIMKEDVIQGAGSFIALTGDAETAIDQLETFARVSLATGASMDDVSRSGAAMSQSMGIVGEDFEQAFSILIASGKAGAVELKDVAQVMAKLSAVSATFAEGQGLDALAETGAALQLVVRAYGGNASEGSNALSKLMSSMVKAAPELKKLGVDVFGFDENGKQFKRRFSDIIKDISKTTLANDETALQKLLGSKEALAAFNQLTILKGEWSELTGVTRDSTDAVTDYATVSKSAPIQVAKAWNRFKNMLVRVFSRVVTVMGWMLDHTELLKIALVELGIVITVFSRKAVLSFIAAAAPLILMAALLAIVALLIEDLVVTLTGGDSAIKKVWGLIAEHWRKELFEFFEWLEEKLDDVQEFGGNVMAFLTNSRTPQQIRLDQSNLRRAKKANARAFAEMEASSNAALIQSDRRIADVDIIERWQDAPKAVRRAVPEGLSPEGLQEHAGLFEAKKQVGANSVTNITINESEDPGNTQRAVQEALIQEIDNTP